MLHRPTDDVSSSESQTQARFPRAAGNGPACSRMIVIIEATDRQIDRLVYEFYDLTDEEISIVEEATQP